MKKKKKKRLPMPRIWNTIESFDEQKKKTMKIFKKSMISSMSRVGKELRV